MKTILIVLCFPFLIYAQDISQKQQLLRQIDVTDNIQEKVGLYIDLAWEYILEENDSALVYSDKALRFSEDNNYHLGTAMAYETKGLYNEIVEGNYEKASLFYFKGIDICDTYNLDYSRSIYHSLGVMFHTSDNYEKAKAYYEIAFNKAIDANDLELQKKCLTNLGTINSSQGNYEKAEELLLKSLELDIRQEYDFDIYANLGNLYIRQKKYEKALPFLERSIEEHPNNHLGHQNLTYYIDAKVGLKDTTGMGLVIKRAKKTIENTRALRDNSLLAMSLSNYYRLVSDYESALEYRDMYLSLYETIKEKQRDATVYELETKYQTEKTQEALLKKEKEQQLYLVLFIFGVLTASILAFLFYKNRKQNQLLSRQKALLETTIDEKNVLLKEIHHRVKNSFQIVSSLLYLQSENVENQKAKTAIKEAENRVRSMVLVHQKLYNKEELVGINTKEYISDLVKDISESHQFHTNAITFKLNIEPHILDLETITPLGLILNELIINTMKHAFPDSIANPQIDIDFSKVEDAMVLKVSDNGKGFEGKIKQSSFGISLMKALSKSLKATLEYDSKSNSGTTATLTIKKYKLLSN